MTPEEKKKLDEAHKFMQDMKRFDRIPLDVEKALSYRFGLRNTALITQGGKTATSENQAVDEAGSGTYSVLKAPDRFVKLVDGQGNISFVPAYD